MQESSDSSTYAAWYLVFICMVAYVFSFVDRQILALLIEPVREDLQISDTQFSLLHGLSFALFYAVMGLPIARMADRASRKNIIAVGVAVWSFATMLCGASKSFWQLFLARMGVGAGEAALSPAAYSMISDSFPKSRLGLALGIYSAGSFVGSGLAFLIGGVAIEWVVINIGTLELPLIGTVKPWQMTFFIVGAPGLLLALLFWLSVREPMRKNVAAHSEGYSIAEVLDYIKDHRRAFVAHFVGFSLLALLMFSLLSWAPAFLLRNFDMSTAEVGTALGIVVLIANVSGVVCSGQLTDALSRRGYADAALRAGMLGGLGALIPTALFPFAASLPATLATLAVALFFASFPLATSAAALQQMAPNQMRAQVTAVFFLFLNLFGITGGSTLVALCTDYLFRSEQAVGFSMALIGSCAGLLAISFLAWGLGSFSKLVEAQYPGQKES